MFQRKPSLYRFARLAEPFFIRKDQEVHSKRNYLPTCHLWGEAEKPNTRGLFSRATSRCPGAYAGMSKRTRGYQTRNLDSHSWRRTRCSAQLLVCAWNRGIGVFVDCGVNHGEFSILLFSTHWPTSRHLVRPRKCYKSHTFSQLCL